MAEMKKLEAKDMQSADIVKQNIEQLNQIFPEVFSEDKINFKKLEAVLGNNTNKEEEHYNFTWHGKKKAERLAQTPSTGTLRPEKDKSVDFDNTQNLFIEGDNLEVLKLLQKSYHQKVKMIYIDPPYNTGNDFVYTDDFKDGIQHYLELTGQVDSKGKKLGTNTSSTGRYHTNWLNMMYPRLKLARNLLQDDGVIFISIDDNEQANLKKICDEVFGEVNFVYLLSVVNKLYGNDNSSGMMKTEEYCLMYAKKKKFLEIGVLLIEEDNSKHWKIDNVGFWKKGGSIKATGLASKKEDRPNLFFPLYINEKNLQFNLEETDQFSYKLIPTIDGKNGRWVWSKMKFIEHSKEVIIQKTKNGYSVYKKQRPQIGDLPSKRGKTTFYSTSYSTANSNAQIKSLFDGKIFFDFTKSSYLIKDFISLANTTNSSIVLDFFAGSGTTADAVMQLNAEDGGSRKCISVQLPEKTDEKSEAFKAGYKNIAEISKERIRRAAKKIKQKNPDYDGDLGFKVFKLDSSNIKRWEANFDNLKLDLMKAAFPVKKNRSKDDIVYEILLKYGLDLTLPMETRKIAKKEIYIIGFGALIICLDENINMEVVDGICSLKTELNPEIMRVVFDDSGFRDDAIKTNTIATLRRSGIEDIKSL